jgi:hypothetical protein
MKYVLRQVTVMMVLFFSVHLVTCQEGTHDTDNHWTEGQERVLRSHHGATYDMVTGAEHSPFMFTTSPLGHSLRATSILLGQIHEAAEDSAAYEYFMEHLDCFCEQILNLYVLCHKAFCSAGRQLHAGSEKSGYLTEEIEHVRQRLIVLSEAFESLVAEQSHERSAVLVNLHILINKTGHLLAL